MPSDAAALIETLRAHPKACGMIRIDVAVIFNRDVVRFRDLTLMSDATPVNSDHFELGMCAITGACVEKCDELGIFVDQENTTEKRWYWFPKNTLRHDPNAYDTRLAAALAALERHDAQ